MDQKPSRLLRILDVPGRNPEDARRRRLLNGLLMIMAVSSLIVLIVLLIVAPLGIAGNQDELRLLQIGSP